MSENKACPRKAEYIVLWAGELKIACQTHANDLATIGEVIGSPVQARMFETDEPCYGQDDFKEREDAKKETEE